MKKWISILFIVAMITSLIGCGNSSNENVAVKKQKETCIFIDDTGREVEVPKHIESYVATGPLAQIITFAIAPDEMAGLASKWYDSATGIIDEKYLELPYFGQLYGSADLNLEELAYVGPELIIDIGEQKDSTISDLNTLQEQTNIPTIFISANMEDMPETFRKLGVLLGKEKKGEELALFCERTYQRTLSIMEKVGNNKVNGLFVVGEGGQNVLAKSSFQAEIFDLLVNNLAVVNTPLSKGTGNEVSMEQIAMWNPDFILFGPKSIYSVVGSDETWKAITAIQNNAYIEVPEGPHNWMGSPPAVQQYLGLIWLTAQLYPEYCDYDMKTEIQEFYRLFYAAELTETKYEALLEKAILE